MAIHLQESYQWRFFDESNGLILPYYTKPALDWLQSININNKTVFEYGLGASSVWYARKCKRLFGVDNNPNWFDAVDIEIGTRSSILLKRDKKEYVDAINKWEMKFDVIVIDGIERDECVKPALSRLQKGGLLIVDNWMQRTAWVANEETQNILLPMKHTIYKQPDHVDWQTAVFTK